MAADETLDWAWKHTLPYNNTENTKDAVWQGSCYCKAVQYELTRKAPLASKYCHCSTCQRLHAAPFQWAAIFHKDDLRFRDGSVEALMFYSSGERKAEHSLPCKALCRHCFAPIFDEGRKMLMLFPPLVDGISQSKAREAFKAQMHIFYGQRVVDFTGDGLPKWQGLNDDSPLLDDHGRELSNGEKEETKDKQS